MCNPQIFRDAKRGGLTRGYLILNARRTHDGGIMTDAHAHLHLPSVNEHNENKISTQNTMAGISMSTDDHIPMVCLLCINGV